MFKIPENMSDADAATQGCAIITIVSFFFSRNQKGCFPHSDTILFPLTQVVSHHSRVRASTGT